MSIFAGQTEVGINGEEVVATAMTVVFDDHTDHYLYESPVMTMGEAAALPAQGKRAEFVLSLICQGCLTPVEDFDGHDVDACQKSRDALR